MNTYGGQNVPVKTSIGFHPQTGALLMQQPINQQAQYTYGNNSMLTAQIQQPRVASAHQEKDQRKRLIMFEKGGVSVAKKTKKKGSHSNASRVSTNQQLTEMTMPIPHQAVANDDM